MTGSYDPSTGEGLPADRLRLDAHVRGRVQGVGFRAWTWDEAQYLGLDGSVANELDGSVHVIAEGSREVLDAFLERLHEGPPSALVERVIVRWEPARGEGPGFRIASAMHRGD